MNKYGIDVSVHQSTINWDKVKGQIDFAILRLGWIGNKENHTLDTTFERNYNECKRLGIPVGVYVYCYSSSVDTAKSGANWVVKQLSGKTLDLPVYIDMEDNSIANKGKDILTNICFEFNIIIEKAGYWAGVYANKNWYDNYLHNDKIKERFTTWIATYVNAVDKYKGEYDIWQNSSKGRVSGISGNVDTNFMYRDLMSEIKGSKVNTSTTVSTPTVTSEKTYTVKKGDTLSEIASKYGTTYQVLAKYNGIADPDKIKIGQVIKIPTNGKVSTANNSTSNNITYVVKKGDTLSKIASKYGTTYQKIAKDNNISDPDKIYAGQKLIIKK